MRRIEFGYEDNLYRIDCSNPSPNFRLYGHGIEIFFTAEWKHGGSYFQIKSVTKNGKTYSAQRYHYKYIPLIREATYKIYNEIGLYDYMEQCHCCGRVDGLLDRDVKRKPETLSRFLGRKLLPRM